MTIGTRPRIAALGAVVLVALAAGCSSETTLSDAPVESTSFPFSGDALTVRSDSSDLELVAADVDEVQVERRVGGSKVGDDPEPVWELDRDTLTLGLDCNGISVGCDAAFSVTVPRDVSVDVRSDDGRVTATGFSTDLTVDADDGDVRLGLPDSAYAVETSAKKGDITVDVTEDDASDHVVKAGTRNGGITIGGAS